MDGCKDMVWEDLRKERVACHYVTHDQGKIIILLWILDSNNNKVLRVVPFAASTAIFSLRTQLKGVFWLFAPNEKRIKMEC